MILLWIPTNLYYQMKDPLPKIQVDFKHHKKILQEIHLKRAKI